MGRPRSFDEPAVVTAARACFHQRGYGATSLDDISAATGLGKGSLYGAFGSKRELFLRVLEDYCADAVGGLARLTEGPDDEALVRLGGYLVANAVGSTASADRGCMIARSAAELGRNDAEVSGRATRTFAAVRDALRTTIAAAQRAGDIAPGVDPDASAGVLLAVLRGTEALARAGAPADELVDIAEAALAGLPRPESIRA